jgi:lipopolysaccharide biosynthesis protein
VHYPDVWDEIRAVLAERLEYPFHLVLTHAGVDGLGLPDTRYLIAFTQLRVENRGRDIRPFLHALAAMPPFEIGLKLHTKKSPQRDDGAIWRDGAMRSLLPPGASAEIINHLRAEQRIGLVAPEALSLSVDPWVLVNEAAMVRIMATLCIELEEDALVDAYFAAGSMFWFRRAALEQLVTPPVLDLFEPESGQLDGTIAHGMERIFAVEAGRRGFVSLAMPALMQSSPSKSRDELLTLARKYADIPSPQFPLPGIAATPESAPQTLAAPRRWKGLLGSLFRPRRAAAA